MNKKKLNKKLRIFMILALAVLVLAACGTGPIDANSTGFWDGTIVYNFSRVIVWLSDILGGNYGVGIIVFTILVKIILIPLTMYQTKGTEKMQAMQPELKELQTKYASKDPETQQKLQEETAKLNEKYDYSPLAGCLPMIVQLPVLMGLYQSISRTEILATGDFLWMQLGEPDPFFIIPILAAVLTWYSTKLTMINNTSGGNQMAIMQWTMPAMILFMGLTLPSAVSLYWVTSTAFTIGQTLVLNNPYKKREIIEDKEKQASDLERRLEKARRNPRGKRR